MDVIAFSLKFNALLSEKKWSNIEFSQKIGVKSASTITNWMLGKSFPDAKQIIKICEVLDISISDLFGENPPNKLSVAPNVDNTELIKCQSRLRAVEEERDRLFSLLQNKSHEPTSKMQETSASEANSRDQYITAKIASDAH